MTVVKAPLKQKIQLENIIDLKINLFVNFRAAQSDNDLNKSLKL